MINLHKVNLVRSCTHYFFFMMVFFRPISYLVNVYETDMAALSMILHMLFYINYACLGVVVCLLFSKMRRLPVDGWVLLGLSTVGLLFTVLFRKENVQYLQDVLISIVYGLVSYCVIRLRFVKIEETINKTVKLARILACALLLTLAVKFQFNVTEYMNYSDAMAIICALLLYNGFINRAKIDWLMGLVSFASIVFWGSRGAILSIAILFGLFFFFQPNSVKKQIVIGCGVVALTILYIFSDALSEVIMHAVQSIGISSRTLEKLLSGAIFDDSQRLIIYGYLLMALNKSPLTGLGICGDRYYSNLANVFWHTSTTYAHNIIVELLVDYGYVLGSIIVVTLLYILVKKYIFNKSIPCKTKCYIAPFFVISFVQLLTSRSYLNETGFFILLALIQMVNQKNRGVK